MTDLVLQDISKSYGIRQVLSGFCAVFPAGQTSCIMGPSGCGKTTLLRIIMGLEQADRGAISGRPARCCAVFQENRLFEEFSPISNVAAVLPGPRRSHEGAVTDCLCALGLGDSLRLPVSTLSGGMKRRVAIARAILAPGDLLILDEPFTGLDHATLNQVLGIVKGYSQGKTTLLVTHDPKEQEALAQYTLHMPPIGRNHDWKPK